MKPHVLGLAALGSTLVALAAYLLTLAPSVGFVDSGELAAVAHTFGIAHPTGYPLFTLLAGLWALLPLGDGIYRLNVLAAVWCAAAVGVFVLLNWSLLGVLAGRVASGGGKRPRRGRGAGPDASALDDPTRLVVAVFGALVIGLSRTFWSTALSIEVYSLHVLMLALVLWAFAAAVFGVGPDERARTRRWMLFALLLGLSFANHLATALLAPAMLVACFWTWGVGRKAWTRIAVAVPAFLAGLLPYLYLPLRAAAEPALNWGNPSTPERFLAHVLGRQYRVWMFSGTGAADRQLSRFLVALPAEFAYVLLGLAALGAVYAILRHRRIGVFLLLLFLGCVGYAINYDIPDIDAYFLLAYVTTGIWVACGLAALLEWTRRGRRTMAAVVAGAGVGLLLVANAGRVSERDNHLVEDYTRNLLRSLAPNALLLSHEWSTFGSASLYYQQVERVRPDVVVLDTELLRRSWYVEQIRRWHPDVYASARAEFDAFETEVRRYERGLPFDPNVVERGYRAMLDGLVRGNLARRPVGLTLELAGTLAPWCARVPEGLAFRLYPPGRAPALDPPAWDAFTYRPSRVRGPLADWMPERYTRMLSNRGILYLQARRYDEALAYFDRALRFMPGDAATLELRARCLAAR